MHELVGVVVGPEFTRATVQDAVAEALAPFEERWDDDTEEHSGWWDYWAIGGRWTGVWRPNYEAQDDPRNIDPRPCPICGGTGHRPDIGNANREEYIAWCGGCNGCQGKGHQVKWPSEWLPIEGDVLSVEQLLADASLRVPRRLVLPDAGVLSREDWDGDKSYDWNEHWAHLVRERLAPFRAAKIVSVDVHN